MTRIKITIALAILTVGALANAVNAAQLKTAPAKPADLGRIAAPAPGATEDHYCKNGHPKFAACTPAFVAACKKVGGTMSGEQGWGGRTCWTPS